MGPRRPRIHESCAAKGRPRKADSTDGAGRTERQWQVHRIGRARVPLRMLRIRSATRLGQTRKGTGNQVTGRYRPHRDGDQVPGAARKRTSHAQGTTWPMSSNACTRYIHSGVCRTGEQGKAVSTAYENTPEDPSRRARYRDPDAIRGGTWEAFERVMKSQFRTGLRKRETARRISARIDPSRSSSRSFKVFCEAVLEAAA